jgi:hypothetical protein
MNECMKSMKCQRGSSLFGNRSTLSISTHTQTIERGIKINKKGLAHGMMGIYMRRVPM